MAVPSDHKPVFRMHQCFPGPTGSRYEASSMDSSLTTRTSEPRYFRTRLGRVSGDCGRKRSSLMLIPEPIETLWTPVIPGLGGRIDAQQRPDKRQPWPSNALTRAFVVAGAGFEPAIFGL
jgi:hypothetical protein